MRRTISTSILALACLSGLAFAADGLVSQKGKTFTPAELDRTVGSTLAIPNDDDTPHNITVRPPDGTTRNLGMQKPGDTVTIPLDQVGEYAVRCGIHPKMKLAVIVR